MKQKITFVLSLLFGLMFVNAGLNKFFNYLPVPENLPEKMVKAMTAIMEIGWLLPLVATAELVGGILIIIPRTRALGALIILPVFIGIILTNTVQDTSGLPLVAVLAVILAWIMYTERAKYLPLLSK